MCALLKTKAGSGAAGRAAAAILSLSFLSVARALKKPALSLPLNDQNFQRLRKNNFNSNFPISFFSFYFFFSPAAAEGEAFSFTSSALMNPASESPPPPPPILMRRLPLPFSSSFFSFGTRTCSTPCSTSAFSSFIFAEGGRRTERDWKLEERSER